MPPDYVGKVVIDNLPLLLEGFWITIWLSILSSLISLVLGTVIGVARIVPFRPLRNFGTAYVEFFRNTPLLIQLFFFYHGLPRAGITFSAFESALWSLAIYHAAYVAEAVRAGIQSIHRGQMEAARSLGFSYLATMRYIILPQAFAVVIPPLGNLFIALLKNTSLASTIAVAELLYQGEVLDSRSFRTFEVFTAVGILYLCLTLPLGGFVNLVERRLARAGRGA